MRISKQEAAANRARVLEAAARLIREKGFEGVAVAEVMREAGLTHGGFYNHFTSKEELGAEAVREAFHAACERLSERAAADGPAALGRYIDRYLSLETRDAPGRSCPMASLGTDAARSGQQICAAFADGVATYIDAFTPLFDEGRGNGEARAAAITTISTLIGALTLARACADSDGKLSREILRTVRDCLKQNSTA